MLALLWWMVSHGVLVNLEAWCKHRYSQLLSELPRPDNINFIFLPCASKKKKKRQRKSRCSLDPSVPCVGFWGEFNFSASVSVLTSHAPPCWVSGFICPCLLLPFSFVGHICPVYVTYCMWLKPVSGFNRRRVQCWTPPVILCASL